MLSAVRNDELQPIILAMLSFEYIVSRAFGQGYRLEQALVIHDGRIAEYCTSYQNERSSKRVQLAKGCIVGLFDSEMRKRCEDTT